MFSKWWSRKKLRVLIYQEQGWFVAQCLEYDVRAQARTIPDVIKYISLALIETKQDSLQRHGRAFACVDLAPEQFQKMWHDRILDMQPSRQEFFTAPSDDVPMSLALAP